MLDPDEARTWLRLIFRDVAAPTLGLVILIHDTLLTAELRYWALILGATLLGLPAASRLDAWLGKNGDGKGGSK